MLRSLESKGERKIRKERRSAGGTIIRSTLEMNKNEISKMHTGCKEKKHYKLGDPEFLKKISDPGFPALAIISLIFMI
jgi:hypothetical protein